MKCPHCAVEIHEEFNGESLAGGGAFGQEGGISTVWTASTMVCPACLKAIIRLHKGLRGGITTFLVYPRGNQRPAAPVEVPLEMAEDYNEAATVLEASPKASAALSRRCLQAVLRAQAYTQHDLAKAIDAVLLAKVLPSSLADNLDAVRNIGNFAAHPMKDTNSGQILPVEEHEAEWNLDVLDGLFDYYYVHPAKAAAKRAALNAKLNAAGKPPMKQ